MYEGPLVAFRAQKDHDPDDRLWIFGQVAFSAP